MRIDDQASPPVLSRMLVSLALLGRLVAHAEAQTPAISAGAVAFSDVTVIDVGNGRRMEHQTVVLDGGRIVAMGNVARVEIPQQARRIDGRGKYLIPGLIDTHVHLATGPDRDSLSALPALLAHGVTGVRDAGAGGQDEWLVALRSRAERGEIPSPRIYVSGMISGRAVARSGRGSAAALARHLVGLKVNGLKIRDGLTMDDIRAIVAVAKEAGVPVFGHTYDAVNRERDETYTLDAIRAGAVGTMHIMGSPQIGKNRLPDPPPGPRFGGNWQDWWVYHASYWLHTDPAAERALIETMVARHAWIEPTLITEDWITNADYYRRMWSERRVPGSFATTREGFPNLEGAPLEQYRQSFARMKDFVRRFHAAGGVVTTGTDCIPACGYGLEDELRLLVDAGLPPAAALRAATLDAARVLGWQDRVGRVATGMAADLVLLDDDPLRDIRNVGKIQAVVTNGRYLDRNALNALQPGAGPPFPPPARLVDVGGWRLHLD